MNRNPSGKPTPADWLERIQAGDKRALSKALSEVESATDTGRALVRAAMSHGGKAHLVGITGAPGVGKSTLLQPLVSEWRARDKTVGVLAVDPSSPFSGGAILGDRVRMSGGQPDHGVFFRSVASRGETGGLAPTTALGVELMDAAGFDIILIETVGAGQGDVGIAFLAHTRLVLCAPDMGDQIQVIKAGIMEIADILLVTKSDLPGAQRTAAQMEEMVGTLPRKGWRVPVLNVAALGKVGITQVVDAVDQHGQHLGSDFRVRGAWERTLRMIARHAAKKVQRRLDGLEGVEVERLCEKVRQGTLDYEEAATELLKTF